MRLWYFNYLTKQKEAICESLKNVLLVMNASNAFPSLENEGTAAAEKQALWTATWEKIDKFLPGLREELFPPPSIKTEEESITS